MPGESFISFNYFYYTTVRITDGAGSSMRFPNGGRFTNHWVSVYFEHGLTERITVEANLPYSVNRFSDDFIAVSGSGFADQEVGMRYVIRDGTYQLAARGLISFPFLYTLKTIPELGFDQYAAQVSMVLGSGFTAFTRGWWIAELGYRHYFGDASNQIRYFLLGGLHISDTVMGMVKINGTHGLTRGEFASEFNPSIVSGFSLIKTTLSFAYEINELLSVEAGYVRDIVSWNSGLGHGIMLSVWLNF